MSNMNGVNKIKRAVSLSRLARSISLPNCGQSFGIPATSNGLSFGVPAVSNALAQLPSTLQGLTNFANKGMKPLGMAIDLMNKIKPHNSKKSGKKHKKKKNKKKKHKKISKKYNTENKLQKMK